MITRILAILLTPILVLGNSFAHASCHAAHSSQGKNRTHIHLSHLLLGFGVQFTDRQSPHNHPQGENHHGDHTHAHVEDDHNQGHASHSDSPAKHDSDAVYLVIPDDDLSLTDGVVVNVDTFWHFRNFAIGIDRANRSVSRPRDSWGHIHGPPLYILHASLRI